MDGISGIIATIKSSGVYIWLLLLALAGGSIQYLDRIKRKGLPFSLPELLGEWLISGFAGLLTMHLCLWQGWSLHLAAVLTGIAGHMGGRAIYMIQAVVTDSIHARVNIKPRNRDD